MAKYRKKPVVIEATQFVCVMGRDGEDKGFVITSGVMPSWLADGFGKAFDEPGSVRVAGNTLVIKTLEGDHTASPNDYIIQGVKGELYPCKPDIFEATYEVVD